MRQKPEISAVLVGHLARMQTLPSYVARSEFQSVSIVDLFCTRNHEQIREKEVNLRAFLNVFRTLSLKYSTFHCFNVLYKKNYCIEEQVPVK